MSFKILILPCFTFCLERNIKTKIKANSAFYYLFLLHQIQYGCCFNNDVIDCESQKFSFLFFFIFLAGGKMVSYLLFLSVQMGIVNIIHLYIHLICVDVYMRVSCIRICSNFYAQLFCIFVFIFVFVIFHFLRITKYITRSSHFICLLAS